MITLFVLPFQQFLQQRLCLNIHATIILRQFLNQPKLFRSICLEVKQIADLRCVTGKPVGQLVDLDGIGHAWHFHSRMEGVEMRFELDFLSVP